MVEVVRNGVRSVDPERAATVARVRALYETGGFTHVTLAAHLNASGIPSVRGGRWHPSTVAKAVRVARGRVAGVVDLAEESAWAQGAVV